MEGVGPQVGSPVNRAWGDLHLNNVDHIIINTGQIIKKNVMKINNLRWKSKKLSMGKKGSDKTNSSINQEFSEAELAFEAVQSIITAIFTENKIEI